MVCESGGREKIYPVNMLSSERIIVRASNPGQFDPDCGGGGGAAAATGAGAANVGWSKDGDMLYHMGKVRFCRNMVSVVNCGRICANTNLVFFSQVGINTDQSSMGGASLTVHGNIQLSGQILQPSDLRIKELVRELDSRRQLDNVNKIKIVEYRYRPEFAENFPPHQRRGETPRQTNICISRRFACWVPKNRCRFPVAGTV